MCMSEISVTSMARRFFCVSPFWQFELISVWTQVHHGGMIARVPVVHAHVCNLSFFHGKKVLFCIFLFWQFELISVWMCAKRLPTFLVPVPLCKVIHNQLNCVVLHTIPFKPVGVGTASACPMVKIKLHARFEIKTTQDTNKAITRSNSNATIAIGTCDSGSAQMHSINFRNG